MRFLSTADGLWLQFQLHKETLVKKMLFLFLLVPITVHAAHPLIRVPKACECFCFMEHIMPSKTIEHAQTIIDLAKAIGGRYTPEDCLYERMLDIMNAFNNKTLSEQRIDDPVQKANAIIDYVRAPYTLEPKASALESSKPVLVKLQDMNQPMAKKGQAMQSTLIIHMPDINICFRILKDVLPCDRRSNMKFIIKLAQMIGGRDVQEGRLIYAMFDQIADFNDDALNNEGSAIAIKNHDTKIYQLVAHFKSLSLQQDAQLIQTVQQQHVAEVRQIMTENIDKVLARGKEFEELWERSAHLG